ncbi:hypothetical protein BCR41DRAFT_36570 [Lobosporangium transversale]|uniref:Uncharacterized protein n=1 Tax=Lobosporangium transversale TaxID=64571 RepID=A0A1Y2GSU1_9FUNG|nr:hypothetical protein BCR41DRAFT_36570 [Lobosporangium transversale]ORZ20151.1 hypothetical protein BCR41DRAFT_36570 [Lobosporangium transversale]|eukprot:XP_021882691.1 hypothetical protein BCR41DRAFT_36570 [Lobosporangium transversale]
MAETNHLSSQIQAMDSILAMASESNPPQTNCTTTLDTMTTDSTTISLPLLKSFRVGQMILEAEASQAQLAMLDAQLRNIEKQLLVKDVQNLSADPRICCLESFTSQIQFLIENRVQLLDILDTPTRAEHLLLHQQHHKEFVDLFKTIQREVLKIQTYLEAIAWKEAFFKSADEVTKLKSSLKQLTVLVLQQTQLIDASHTFYLSCLLSGSNHTSNYDASRQAFMDFMRRLENKSSAQNENPEA